MATTASPLRDLKQVNHIGGTPYAGSTRLLPIASGYGTNIYNGSVVAIVAAGTVEIVTDLQVMEWRSSAFPAWC